PARAPRGADRRRAHRHRARGGLPGAPRTRRGGLRTGRRHAVDRDRLPRGRAPRGAGDPAAHRGAMSDGAAIREAFIVPAPGDAGRTIAGVPLLVRTILVLQRAGIERCTLVGAPAPADARIRCHVETAPVLVPPSDPALRLVVAGGTVID